MLKKSKMIAMLLIAVVLFSSCSEKADDRIIIGTYDSVGFENVTDDLSAVKIALIDSYVTKEYQNVNVRYDSCSITAENETHADMIIKTIFQTVPSAQIDLYVVADEKGKVDNDLVIESLSIIKDQEYDIINMSLCTKKNAEITELINDCHNKEMMIVASAGNEGEMQVGYPACLDNVISVGALDRSGRLAVYSNTGKIDFVMPGKVELLDSCENIDGSSVSAVLFTCLGSIVCEKYGVRGDELLEKIKSISVNPNNNDKIGYGQPVLSQQQTDNPFYK